MSDKIKPWQGRKPRHHGQGQKRIVPLRAGNDKRISPLRVKDERIVPMMVDDYYRERDGWEN
jgi:hypothetical protein